MQTMIRKKKGSLQFTLIELLVVIAIIAILTSILLPALNSARRKVFATVCGNQMRQTYLMLMNYAGDHDDYMPEGNNFASILFLTGYVPPRNGKLINPAENLAVFRFPHVFLCPQLKNASDCPAWDKSKTPLEWNRPTIEAAKTYSSWDPEWLYGWGQTGKNKKLNRFTPNSMILGDMQLEEPNGSWYNHRIGSHYLMFYYVGTSVALGHENRQNIVMLSGGVRSVLMFPYSDSSASCYAARMDFTLKR